MGNKEVILGLDISTSSTGYSLLNTEGGLIDLGYIRLSHLEDIFSKAQRVTEVIRELSRDNNIQRIFIEQNLQAFRPGLSSAKTLITLARFNGIVTYLCYLETGLKPKFINVNTARKTVGLKISRQIKCGKTTKDQVLDWVTLRLDDFSWPKKILKSGPRRGKEVLEPGCYDMADAYVISLAGFTTQD